MTNKFDFLLNLGHEQDILNQHCKRDELNQYYDTKPDSTKIDTKTSALYLGVKHKTLECWRSQHRYNLPYTKIGSKVYYFLGDLRKFVAERIRTHTGEGK